MKNFPPPIVQGGGEDTMSSKYQKLDADPKAIQQINFTGNLTRAGGARMYFIIEEAKETVLESSKGTVKALWFFFILIK